MRYIYALRKKEERNRTDLKIYEKQIEKVLEELNLLKEGYVVVGEKSFEFSASGCVPKGRLRRMGKLLSKTGVGQGGFARQNNKVYAFVSYDESRVEDEQVLVELVDGSTLDFEHDQDDIPEWVRFYRKIELCTSYISSETARNIFGDFSKDEESIYLAELKHHHIAHAGNSKYPESGVTHDSTVKKKNICIIEHLYSAGLYQLDALDFVDIGSVERISDIGEIKKIKSKFDFDITGDIGPSFKVSTSATKENNQYTFTVHNVGQALATSLSEKGGNPFFYFDYGIGCGRNKFTIPADVKLPIAKEGATILLSHVHEDHWCGFRINEDVLKCRWIIPQRPTKALTKVLASVYLSGGTISLYRANGLDLFKVERANNYMLAGNSESKLKSSRIPDKTHENGNALCIFAEYKGAKYKVVVSGDQDYDYQNPYFLSDVNLLVACHHGGTYSWNGTAKIPEPDSNSNEIVYSYGAGNKYSHPSKTKEYAANGWKTEHHTPVNKDFMIDLKLINNTAIEGKLRFIRSVGDYKV